MPAKQSSHGKKPSVRLQRFLAKRSHGRNDAWVDGWSFIHLLSGVLLGWIMPPLAAVTVMILWEPFEIFVLSPFLARYHIVFGYESLRNSLSDIVFDIAGIWFGYYIVLLFVSPPLHLF
ncbi:MAG TPA: hypothetical protein VG604_01115 [Candidatus Saccharimonadales bacterium]|nr:hypothetical protein [Candidatus Saccharimonadales bacterium]